MVSKKMSMALLATMAVGVFAMDEPLKELTALGWQSDGPGRMWRVGKEKVIKGTTEYPRVTASTRDLNRLVRYRIDALAEVNDATTGPERLRRMELVSETAEHALNGARDASQTLKAFKILAPGMETDRATPGSPNKDSVGSSYGEAGTNGESVASSSFNAKDTDKHGPGSLPDVSNGYTFDAQHVVAEGWQLPKNPGPAFLEVLKVQTHAFGEFKRYAEMAEDPSYAGMKAAYAANRDYYAGMSVIAGGGLNRGNASDTLKQLIECVYPNPPHPEA